MNIKISKFIWLQEGSNINSDCENEQAIEEIRISYDAIETVLYPKQFPLLHKPNVETDVCLSQ